MSQYKKKLTKKTSKTSINVSIKMLYVIVDCTLWTKNYLNWQKKFIKKFNEIDFIEITCNILNTKLRGLHTREKNTISLENLDANDNAGSQTNKKWCLYAFFFCCDKNREKNLNSSSFEKFIWFLYLLIYSKRINDKRGKNVFKKT